MRSRRTAQEEMAAIARRRLELLGVELAGLRDDLAVSGEQGDRPGEGAAGLSDPFAAPDAVLDAPISPPGRHARRPTSLSGRAGAWMHDRLPATLQGRVQLSAAHLSVVALMVALALAVTSWWVVRAGGTTSVVPAATWSESDVGSASEVGGASDAGAEPESGSGALVTPAAEGAPGESEPSVVVVDVAGKVRRPGIATLPLGSRVVDALQAAGGARRGVDLTTLNLARVLVDGEQILVGVPPPEGVAAPAASAPGTAPGGEGLMVNINTADQAALEELPGVGPVTAASILRWRSEHGPFTAVDELMEVSGIGEATLAEIAPYVTL
jgi:competence protein ComEA